MASYLLNLLLISLIAFVAIFWWKTLGIKQIAYQVAKRRCDELGVQLLDQSIMLRGIALKRAASGNISILRKFVFEFSSTGEERYRGEIHMLGLGVNKVELDAHRI